MMNCDIRSKSAMPMTLRIAASALAALTLAGCQKVEDQAFGMRLHAYLRDHPEVVREAAQKLRDKRAAAARQALIAARSRLETDPRDFVANPGGHVTVVQFFDNRCLYCSAAAPEVLALIAQNPDVRFVFKQYPIFGSTSDYAARVSLTAQGKARGLELYRAFLAQKDLTPAQIDALAAKAGLEPTALQLAAADPAIEEQIRDTRALAQEIDVRGAPTFVVAGEIIQGADMERVRAAITRARSSSLSSMAGDLTLRPATGY
jgi:protein-disulfide isomerase